MDAERWLRVKSILAELLDVPLAERAAYLNQHCADPDLKRDVEGFLHSRDNDVTQPGAATLGAASEPDGEARQDSLLGKRIGRYLLVDRIGEGGMGVVFRAFDERMGREVALKLLKKNQKNPRAVERFFREARAASALNHPNIVTVFEAGEAEQGHFIVMELVRGRGLRALIGQSIDVERLVSLGRQSAEALAVAHAAGIVHRDVKPENLMVRDDGYVKVLDFGLARLGTHMQSPTDTTLTGVHTIIGTIKYMSPEQADGRTVGSASDVFSLGLVLYELATGRHPFDAESHYATLNAIVSHHPVPPSRLRAELSGSLEMLLLRMLDKEAERRPSSAEVAAAMAATGSALTVDRRVSAAVAPATRKLVGRLKALGELQAALQYISEGHGLLACVSGEAGIGKSALVGEFLSVAATGGAYFVAHGRCSERLAGGEAYLPLLDALEGLVRSEDGVLARLMKAVAPLWYLQVAPPALQESQSWSQIVSESRSGGTPERLKRELAAFLTEACRLRPIVFFFDDLHWVDLSTVDVLNYVTRQFESLPVLIIAAYRPEELLVRKHPFLSMKQELQGRGLCREMALEFLTRQETEQYIAVKFPRHRLPTSFVDLIYAKTEGSPLFMADVLSYLCERHVLSREQGEWALTRSVPDIATDLPESVRSMIQRKVDVLTDADRHVLVAASVQGYEFDGAVVARVLEIDPADLEEQFDTIDRIHGFVRRVREQEFPDRTLTLRYQFVHVLYQNMLYATLAPARKMSLNRKVGKALEEFYRDKTADVALELAVLFEAAREFLLASHYFCVAARKSSAVFAYEEAVVLGKRARGMLRALPDTPEHRRRELDALMIMGPPASATRGYSSREVQEIYDRASVLCAEFQDPGQLGLALWRLFAINVVRLELETAQNIADRLRHLSQEIQDPGLVVQVALTLGLVAHYRGEFSESMEHFEHTVAGCTLDLRHSMCGTVGFDPLVSAYSLMAPTRLWLGYPDDALRIAEAALRAADETGHPYSLAHALYAASVVAAWRGDWEQLKLQNARALKVTKKGGYSYFAATAICFDGMLLSQDGHSVEGLTRMQEGCDNLRAIQGHTGLRRFTSHLAELLALAGQVDDGLRLMDAELATTGSARFWDAELLRVRGELLLMRGSGGDADEAESCLGRALDVARQQRAKALELRAAISLARLRRSAETAHQTTLSETYHSFTEGLETLDLREARTLLAEMAIR